MDSEGSSSGLPGSDNQDSNEPAPPGTVVIHFGTNSPSTPVSRSRNLIPSSKGVENAKKRLRAFSIQKKSPITPVQLAKPTATGTIGSTVLIGKLNSAKPSTPKVEDEIKKPTKPPKPGSVKKNFQDSYTELQKRTLAEIEDMKRKMELVDLGIPLGLICPSASSDKAMPTKAMPPIKTFLDATKVDEIIRDAKKARAEGKKFKFDYSKILPDYDNPFQRKKEDPATQDKEKEKEESTEKEPKITHKSPHYPRIDKSDIRNKDKSKRKSDRYDSFRRHSQKYDRARKVRDKYKEKRPDNDKDKDNKGKEKDSRRTEKETKELKESAKAGKSLDNVVVQDNKETDLNLNDFLVCDSWSLDNDDKTASPQVEDKSAKVTPSTNEISKESKSKDVTDSKEPKESKEIKESMEETKTKEELEKEALLKAVQSPMAIKKIEKLKPVVDSFEFEIDPNDDDILDMCDVDPKTGELTKIKKPFAYSQDTNMSDSLGDDNFLESVINEIKQENLSDDDSQDKGLVEYDSPILDFKGQGTPELDDSMRQSQRSDYSDGCRSIDSGCRSTESGYKSTESSCKSTESGYKSTESGYKNTESGYKSTESECKSTVSGYKSTESYKSPDVRRKSKDRPKRSESGSKKSEQKRSEKEKLIEKEADFRLSVEKELEALESKMSKETEESLEMWDFVLKICQPLLFRHDKTKCYKQTRTDPTLWWAARPGACGCVRGRGVVLGELRARRAQLAAAVYSALQIPDAPAVKKRSWYPTIEQCLSESLTTTTEVRTKREAPESRPREPDTPQQGDALLLDREYQRFMEAVWPEVAEAQVPSRSTTPVRLEDQQDKSSKEEPTRAKLSSEGWSQESEVEEEVEKSKKRKEDKEKKTRKRKRSSSTLSSTTDDEVKKKKAKKKMKKKSKTKLAKRKRTEKKHMKKLKEKQKKKKNKAEKVSEEEDVEVPKKKLKDKKLNRKQQKLKKILKKKKAKAKSSSSSSSSSSESEEKRKKKKSKKKKEDIFDVNILNNIKAEKLTDDEGQKMTDQDFSPRRQPEKRKEIINVKDFQSDLGVQIKQEVIEEERDSIKMDEFDLSNNDVVVDDSNIEKTEFKEPEDPPSSGLSPQRPDETNLSQCSSQESICSEKPPAYEKDESHLRPSSQNSNYSFNDVIASQSGLYNKGIETGVECDKFEYEQENYEMYEQLAMAYQSDVASNQVPLPSEEGTRRIETVVRLRGEIKCDWRAGGPAPQPPQTRPSRWGLKPGEVNIVLTGAEHCAPGPVYRIPSIANRQDNSTGSYDEAYMDTYGAMDRLQYGDCFSSTDTQQQPQQQSQQQSQQQLQQSQEQQGKERRGTLDDRIDLALRQTVLGDIAKEPENKENDADKENRDKGILIASGTGRSLKRVSFADGYKPGQDSDTEEPPVKKRRTARRRGCAWPCAVGHADHVPLWDALPPPPPPPGSPPPPARAPPPLHLLRHKPPPPLPHGLLPHPPHKFDPNMPMQGFMPPEPPPGFITLQ